MRTGTRILIAAVLWGTTVTAALAEGPYDDGSYWSRVERSQECAWKARESPYPPAFAYGPSYSCNYGPPAAAQYYAPYGYSSNQYNPYYHR